MEKYKIEELIGEGSYGSVYRVRNDQGQVFAYKRIKVDPFLAEETEREIDIMRKLHHPNLLKVYEHHFEDKEEELRIIM
jgi:cyclin-dependent kinase